MVGMSIDSLSPTQLSTLDRESGPFRLVDPRSQMRYVLITEAQYEAVKRYIETADDDDHDDDTDAIIRMSMKHSFDRSEEDDSIRDQFEEKRRTRALYRIAARNALKRIEGDP